MNKVSSIVGKSVLGVHTSGHRQSPLQGNVLSPIGLIMSQVGPSLGALPSMAIPASAATDTSEAMFHSATDLPLAVTRHPRPPTSPGAASDQTSSIYDRGLDSPYSTFASHHLHNLRANQSRHADDGDGAGAEARSANHPFADSNAHVRLQAVPSIFVHGEAAGDGDAGGSNGRHASRQNGATTANEPHAKGAGGEKEEQEEQDAERRKAHANGALSSSAEAAPPTELHLNIANSDSADDGTAPADSSSPVSDGASPMQRRGLSRFLAKIMRMSPSARRQRTDEPDGLPRRATLSGGGGGGDRDRDRANELSRRMTTIESSATEDVRRVRSDVNPTGARRRTRRWKMQWSRVSSPMSRAQSPRQQ